MRAPHVASNDGAPHHGRMRVRRRPVRGVAPVRVRRVLPLHAVPAAHRLRCGGYRARGAGDACGSRRERTTCAAGRPRVGARRSSASGAAPALFSRDPGSSDTHRRSAGCNRRRPGNPAQLPPVRRVRRVLGGDPGRRAPALRRGAARLRRRSVADLRGEARDPSLDDHEPVALQGANGLRVETGHPSWPVCHEPQRRCATLAERALEPRLLPRRLVTRPS